MNNAYRFPSPRWSRLAATLSLCCALATHSPSNAQDMLGVTWNGQLISVDTHTGEMSQVGAGLPRMNALAKDQQGRLWTNGYANGTTYLAEIDPVQLTVTAVHPIGMDIRALARGPGTTLFGLQFGDETGTLVQVDTVTGSVYTIGATELGGIQAMATRGETLYGFSLGAGLVTIDTTTGLATPVGGPSGYVQWLATNPYGDLIGGGLSEIRRFDPETGVSGFVGAADSIYLRGAEFVSFAYPFGDGCGAVGPVELSVTGTIARGGTLTIESSGHTGTSAWGGGTAGVQILGFDTESFLGNSLPMDLEPLLGAAGCQLLVRPDVTTDGYTLAGSMTFVLQIPMELSVEQFYLQHMAFDQDAPGGSVWSNGVAISIRSWD